MKKENIQIRVSEQKKDDIKHAAAMANWTMSQYVLYAINNELKKDGFK